MKKIILLCCCLAATFGARAQLTLDECRSLARDHYPEIRQYDLIRQTTDYTLSNARRSYLPQFQLSAQATWQTEVPNFPGELASMLGIDMPGLKKDQYKIALDLNQTIWDGGKSRADVRIAQAESDESNRSVDVDLYALDSRIDDLFFGILLFEERISQTELTIDLLRSNLDKLRSMVRNGVAMQTDADAVEAELLTVGQQLTEVKTALNSYRLMLSIFIGKELGAEKLQRPEATMPLDMESNRPELALFDARKTTLGVRESMVKSSTKPSFGAFAQGYYGYPGYNFLKDMMSTSWSWNAIVGVKASWNIGGYYTRKNSLSKLRTAGQQVDVQRDIFLFNTRLQSTQEQGEIVRIKKAIADDDRIVALRRSVREAAESKLRNGVIDTNDLLSKITEERTASTARSAREIELLKAIYELKHTINR